MGFNYEKAFAGFVSLTFVEVGLVVVVWSGNVHVEQACDLFRMSALDHISRVARASKCIAGLWSPSRQTGAISIAYAAIGDDIVLEGVAVVAWRGSGALTLRWPRKC